jgi:soluble lytic murein transglycosylase
MSSMVRVSLVALLTLPALTGSISATAQNPSGWDQSQAGAFASGPTAMAGALSRWTMLTGSPRYGFEDYASFLLTYPGLPDETKLQRFAEGRLDVEQVDATRIARFFARFPPVTNPARGRQALALASLDQPDAVNVARMAWRGGKMAPAVEASLLAKFASQFTQDDHDARMDALLWDREADQATRQFAYVSAERRQVFMARLSAVQGSNPAALGIIAPESAKTDAGYVFNIVRQLRRSGQTSSAAALLATRPPLVILPLHPADWVEELLVSARMGDARSAQRIAASIDDAFPPGADVSRMSFGLRDDYTSLMWLGGTKAMSQLGDPAAAVPLFYRYGAAARTPTTKSKGFYWAGLAAKRAGDLDGARRYFEMAAAYSDQFYGMLALERLGRRMPDLTTPPKVVPTAAERAAFMDRPITAAVREAARGAPWTTSIRFFKEIARQAETPADHVLVAQLAQETGRRDLAVILGEEAQAKGHVNFEAVAFPTMPTPPGTDWTMVHAITRQESQFAQNAISHAGASGLMQLMPGTAREQAGRLGLTYSQSALLTDAGYNIQLGDGYFTRMLSYYRGSYPLAAAAYNAGPGNVNKWLAANGDPRNGGIDWVEWIERIPIYETRNYVQRVLQNAAVYEHMNPDKAPMRSPRSISRFIGAAIQD